MTDQNSQFFAILTAVGEAKQANANALGVAWTFAQMGVGDANNTDPVPSRTQIKLINERRRAPLNQITVDPANSSIIIAEQVIPPDVGGWWIREIGLYDAAGDLVAVANCAPSYKPLLAQGTGKTQVVRLNIVVTSTANVELKIDPAVVLATRTYVDSSILAVLPPNKVAGTYAQVRVDSRGVVQQGFNPNTLSGHGITDAYTLAQTDSKLSLKANLASPVFTGVPTVPDAAAGTSSGQAANTKFVATEIARLVASSPAALDTLNELALALGNDPNFATTMTNALAGKMAKAEGGLGSIVPVVGGALADLLTTQFVSVGNGNTTDKPAAISYGTGFHIKYPNGQGEKYAFDMLSGVTNEWFGVRMVGATSAGVWRELWHDGNFNPALKANLASPALTGTPTTPTAAKGTSTTQVSSTAFVVAEIADKAMAKGAGGLATVSPYVNGKIADLDSNQFIAFADLATDKPADVAYGVGVHLKWPTAKHGVDFAGSINSDWFGARYVLSDGVPGPWRSFWHSGNFTPGSYALKSNTLAGYSIGDAYTTTQTNSAIQAVSTALLGGVPAAYNTLKKLADGKADRSTTLAGFGITDAFTKSETFNRADIQYLIAQAVGALLPKRTFTANDFIRIPDVPGGLIICWGTTLLGAEATVDVQLPLTFNTACGAVASVAMGPSTSQGNYSAYATLPSKSAVRVTLDVNVVGGGASQFVTWWAWGN